MNKAQGTIVSAISGYYDVEIENKVVRTRARGVFRDRKQKPLVGDREHKMFVKISLTKNVLSFMPILI